MSRHILSNPEELKKIPDVDGYAFCSQQAGDDAEPKTVANVGEDDHGHGDEVEMGDQVHREETGVAESGKHSNREEREADYNCCGEEDALPKKIVIPKISIITIFLPAVLVKEVEGTDGTEDFCQTGMKENELIKVGVEMTKIIYLVIQEVWAADIGEPESWKTSTA